MLKLLIQLQMDSKNSLVRRGVVFNSHLFSIPILYIANTNWQNEINSSCNFLEPRQLNLYLNSKYAKAVKQLFILTLLHFIEYLPEIKSNINAALDSIPGIKDEVQKQINNMPEKETIKEHVNSLISKLPEAEGVEMFKETVNRHIDSLPTKEAVNDYIDDYVGQIPDADYIHKHIDTIVDQ